MMSKNIDLNYLYIVYIDEYCDDRELLSKEAFIETIEVIIEDQIRKKEF